MGYVSCRIVRGFSDVIEAFGHSSAEFYAKITAADPADPHLRPEFITNVKNYLPWNSYYLQSMNSFV